jgi:hypothetical protein
VVARGAGVVSDGLRIEVELVEGAAGPSMAGGGGARGGTRDGSSRGDLAAKAWVGGRWRRLGVREATWRCLIVWGGALGGGQRLEARYSTEKQRGASGSRRWAASCGAQQ